MMRTTTTTTVALVTTLVAFLCIASVSGRGWLEDKEDASKRIDVFKNWLNDHNVKTDHLKLQVDDHGYSVYLAKDVKALNITIPEELMITYEKVQKSDIFKYIKKLGIQLSKFSQIDLMAVWLLGERNNPDSLWAPYFATLPKYMTTPHFYTPQEKAHAATIPFIGFEDLAKADAAVYKQFFPRLYIRYPEVWPRGTSQLVDFRWASAILKSRMFGLKTNNMKRKKATDPRHTTLWALVPLADMLDHKSGAQIAYNDRKNDHAPFVMRLHDQYQVGDRLFNNHGEHSDYDFLQQYGFIDEEENKNNYLYFSISNSLQPHMLNEMAAAGLPRDGTMRLYKDKYPEDVAKMVGILYSDRSKEEQQQYIREMVEMRMGHWREIPVSKFEEDYAAAVKAVAAAPTLEAKRHAYNFRNLELLKLKWKRLLDSVLAILDAEENTKDDL